MCDSVCVCAHVCADFRCGVWLYAHVHAFVMQCVSVCVSVSHCECGCVYVCACVHMSVCTCAHNLLDSAQKLEDGHAVCVCVCVCVCVYMYICVVCTWHVFIVWVLLGSPVA